MTSMTPFNRASQRSQSTGVADEPEASSHVWMLQLLFRVFVLDLLKNQTKSWHIRFSNGFF
jgi:hypothetical protein